MAILAFFHGEQILFIAFVVLLLVLALLIGTSWLIVRKLRGRFGKRVFLVALVPWTVFGLLAFGEYLRERPNSGPPREISANGMAKRIAGLPENASFGYSGIAYMNGDWYVGTNLGLFEVRDGFLQKAFCPQRDYCVTSGPWLDEADRLLWMLDDQTQDLLSFDGKSWKRMAMPTPGKGYFSRGEVLQGSRFSSSQDGFWMVGGESMWRWELASHSWQLLAQAPRDFSRVDYETNLIGVLAHSPRPLEILEHQPLSFLSNEDEDDFKSDRVALSNETWQEIPNAVGLKFSTDSSVSIGNEGFICTKNGRVLKVTETIVTAVPAPAACEALAKSSIGGLLAAFKAHGIFKFENGSWVQVIQTPYASGAGKYWTQIAESGGEFAYAVTGKPVVDHEHASGRDMRFHPNAPTQLWVSKGKDWQEVTYH